MTQVHNPLPPLPQLSPEDERLIEGFRKTGLTVDELAYTPEFDRLCAEVGKGNNETSKHEVYRRLLHLRKQGRLPRSYAQC